MIEAERNRRLNLWHQLKIEYGTERIKPSILNEKKIYVGGAGIWRDATNKELNKDGVTIGVLHTGRHYPDDLTSTGILYHYPNTNRPPSVDQNEIEATKAASILRLPIFVVTHNPDNDSLRDVYLGWVVGWDDSIQEFLILFQDEPAQLINDKENIDNENFVPFSQRPKKLGERIVRQDQLKFRFDVLRRYGTKCALCDVAIEELLEAIHLIPKSNNGTDDPRNGLVLCVLHHKAFDVGFFGINPETTSIYYPFKFADEKTLGIKFKDITHLKKLPHKEAMSWNWKRFQKKRSI